MYLKYWLIPAVSTAAPSSKLHRPRLSSLPPSPQTVFFPANSLQTCHCTFFGFVPFTSFARSAMSIDSTRPWEIDPFPRGCSNSAPLLSHRHVLPVDFAIYRRLLRSPIVAKRYTDDEERETYTGWLDQANMAEIRSRSTDHLVDAQVRIPAYR